MGIIQCFAGGRREADDYLAAGESAGASGVVYRPYSLPDHCYLVSLSHTLVAAFLETSHLPPGNVGGILVSASCLSVSASVLNTLASWPNDPAIINTGHMGEGNKIAAASSL